MYYTHVTRTVMKNTETSSVAIKVHLLRMRIIEISCDLSLIFVKISKEILVSN